MLNHVVESQWPRRHSSQLGGASFILLLALLVALIPTLPAPRLASRLRAQPELVALAERTPTAQISVIIQKDGTSSNLEQQVSALGGTITMDLHIINAFAARMLARTALTLSRMDGVRWISLDAPVVKNVCATCVDTSRLQNAYNQTIGVDRVWNESPKYLQGQGIGVAVVDSGMNPDNDFYTTTGKARLVTSVYFNSGYNQNPYDRFGHGQHIAGIIGGNGSRSAGAYIGVAPMVNLIDVKVSDDVGAATAANVVNGLQWVNDNRTVYNIKVVNLSLNSSIDESYQTNPISAAAEILWFNKVTVIVAAGNLGKNPMYPPANDPFVITVGATDDRGTPSTLDDVIAPYSGYGKTIDKFDKPDLVAPGTNIVSMNVPGQSVLAQQHPDHIVGSYYFRMSGTSMAAPMVAGAVALLLQDEPSLTPDQVKYRLLATATLFDNRTRSGAGYLNVYNAVHGTTTQSSNTGIPASKLLFSGGSAVNWNSVNWNSVNWNSVNWNSVNWNSVNWNSVNWNSVNW